MSLINLLINAVAHNASAAVAKARLVQGGALVLQRCLHKYDTKKTTGAVTMGLCATYQLLRLRHLHEAPWLLIIRSAGISAFIKFSLIFRVLKHAMLPLVIALR
jgi:hypothetical protein